MSYRTAEGEILDIRTEEAQGFLRKNYPAIMADRPVNMSDSYQFMSSFKIAETMINKFNMGLVSVSQQFSRSRDPRGQEHFMRFRLPETMNLRTVGDSAPELVIMNSHNGRSTLRAYAGIFRMVCENGMVVADRTFGKINLRHFGLDNNYEAFSKVLDGVAANFSRMDLRMQTLDQLMMTAGQQQGLARAMMKARGVPNWVEPEMVLKARRDIELPNDAGQRSAWKTYNVLQESLAESRDVAFERAGARARSLRPLTGARAEVLVNERLWQAMEEFVGKNWPELASQIIEGKAEEVSDPLALPVVTEDHRQEESEPKTTVLRRFEELMALSHEDMATISEDEVKSLSADNKKKLSSRKSYLKKKAQGLPIL
jgi:hypothetical protein